MKCIVGLGNPGLKYRSTRHNIGFIVVDELLKRNNWTLSKNKFNGHYTMETLHNEKVLILEPQTYMNLSGESLKPLMDFYDLAPEDVVVIYDDLDLPLGKIRLRQTGGHGGHNGVRSIIDHLGTKKFNRIRFGIGRPVTPIPVIDYVLGNFQKEEQTTLEQAVDHAVNALEAWMTEPFPKVMNDYNQ
ncbi:aminoacyl-tRNA hydrolase [Gracilibacillus dipsosauri]|uniref:Peptidyl-tRNA hydrolase n=1 Tax=Gracilibacillus dipsosauri TaxID=178340 RepID=A0A317KWH4_9BACI|nr:aminoacyl-tRNA hydrolase [Gracilibacillus dipsosauri]PWU67831.1 aminoacyl-tRNA hydrolase [Gracilibacillus dipsosauri]